MGYLTALDPTLYTPGELAERSALATERAARNAAPRQCTSCDWKGEWTEQMDLDGGGKCPACWGETEDVDGYDAGYAKGYADAITTVRARLAMLMEGTK